MSNIQKAYELLVKEDFSNKPEVMKLLKENLDSVKPGSIIKFGSETYILGIVNYSEVDGTHDAVLLNTETGNRWTEPKPVQLFKLGDSNYICKNDLDKIIGWSSYEIVKGEK